MLTRSASYSDRETAQWATQQVVTANEQVIHRWLAQGTRPRLTIEAAWPSRKEPVGRVQLEGDLLAGLGPVAGHWQHVGLLTLGTDPGVDPVGAVPASPRRRPKTSKP
ncbi:RNase A-like domain-containing protein [Streptomyces sp. OZ13]|uniref:RNase A-like domain-containing protein n=1 Tax=Streptomyces sp. OZ13 TaxID=3452210 RepID=UPI003F88BDAD